MELWYNGCYISAEERFNTVDKMAVHAAYRKWKAVIFLKGSSI
jgi:hypothetical protein